MAASSAAIQYPDAPLPVALGASSDPHQLKSERFGQPCALSSSLDPHRNLQVSSRFGQSVVPPPLTDRVRSAASHGNSTAVAELIDSGVIAAPDKDGRTLIHIAAQNGHVSVIEVLLARGFDVAVQDKLGYTALHRASAQGHVDVVQVLLKAGCPINQQDECGNTAIHAAAWNGYSQTLQLLVSNGAVIGVTNKAGCTAFHSAAQKGHNQSARVLLYSGCAINIKNNSGETALHLAAKHGHAGVAQILLKAKCKINARNKAGETALHLAASGNRSKIAKLLIEAGVSCKIKSKNGRTALDIAKKANCPEIVLLISSRKKSHLLSLRRRAMSDDSKIVNMHHSEADSDSRSERSDLARGTLNSVEQSIVPSGHTKQCLSQSAPNTCQTGTAAVLQPHLSSSQFIYNMPPSDVLNGFNRHRLKSASKPQPTTAHTETAISGAIPGAVSSSTVKHVDRLSPRKAVKKSVRGLLCKYVAKPGVQYYKDLAGNLRQGPVGFTPIDSCRVECSIKSHVNQDDTYELIDAAAPVNVTGNRHRRRRALSCEFRRRSLGRVDEEHGDQVPGDQKTAIKSSYDVNKGQSVRARGDMLPAGGRANILTRHNSLLHSQVSHRRHSVADEGMYCRMDGSHIELQHRQHDVDSNPPIQYCNVDIHNSDVPAPDLSGRIYRTRSDETLSAHSYRHCSHPTRRPVPGPSVVSVSHSISAVNDCVRHHQIPKHNIDSRNLAPRVLCSETNIDSGSVRYRYRTMEQPDLLCMCKNWQECNCISPSGPWTLPRQGPLHSSPVVTYDGDIQNGTVLDLIQSPVSVGSESSPIQQCPAAPAGSPVSAGLVAFSPQGGCVSHHGASSSVAMVMSGHQHLVPTMECGSNPDSGYGSKIYRCGSVPAPCFVAPVMQNSHLSHMSSRQCCLHRAVEDCDQWNNTSSHCLYPDVVIGYPCDRQQHRTAAARQRENMQTMSRQVVAARHLSLNADTPLSSTTDHCNDLYDVHLTRRITSTTQKLQHLTISQRNVDYAVGMEKSTWTAVNESTSNQPITADSTNLNSVDRNGNCESPSVEPCLINNTPVPRITPSVHHELNSVVIQRSPAERYLELSRSTTV